jgi:hypothetical protein
MICEVKAGTPRHRLLQGEYENEGLLKGRLGEHNDTLAELTMWEQCAGFITSTHPTPQEPGAHPFPHCIIITSCT